MSFVSLHSHSHYSLLDGYGSPAAIVKRAKELGSPAIALTDHGTTYGLIEFYKAAKAEGIKPILGCEFYVANRTRFDKEAGVDVKPYHMTILARNNEGYQNILQLATQANLEGFYYKPRIDYGLLKSHGNGLIALSGCLAGHLPRLILSENDQAVDELINKCISIFGKENYFLEIQDHPLIENQGFVNDKIRELAKKHGLGMVLTNDTHYPRPEDKDVHDVLLCIQTGTTIDAEDRMRYVGDFSIREPKKLIEAYKDFPGAIENTLKIAERCDVDFEFGNNLIPSFKTPNNTPADEYLRMLCEDGLKMRFGDEDVPSDYLDRLNFELKTVHDMGFDTYFLIVWDFVKYARDQKIVVGPGRGSAAGSIIAWTLRITELDPITNGLFFERFLNPERVSMPDIDIDFADTRRDEVIDYVVKKYGRDNVAQILTFGTMAPRAAIRDAGRALGYPYAEVDKLSKTVPPPVLGKSASLNVSIKDDKALSSIYKSDPRAKVLLDYARRLEGTVRHVGTHACAVVISEKPLPNYTALQYGASGGGEIVTQYSAKPLEDLGLLKMDFLGLRNLTVIETTCNILRERKGEDVDIEKIPMDDELTFELFQAGDTTGVFQFESGGMKRYLKELKPTVFEDIVAMGALYRPGPMEWIPDYIKGKHNPEKVKYFHDSFKSILEKTYGVAVYQEQILQLARDFAGFSLGEADILRKAVGKKIASLLAEQREKFIAGAVKNGHKQKFAKEVFEKVVEPFAGYGFNKAHAACYGLIAYQTAYLKSHYPIEFMNALLCSDATNAERVVLEIKECNEHDIAVLPPSVNESFGNFTVVDDDTIRFGLLAIKGVGEGPISEIIEVRKSGGPFVSLEDFAKRISPKTANKKLLQALAYSGAFDEFGDRNQIAENYDEISNFSKHSHASSATGQTDIFGIMNDEDHGDSHFHLRDVPKSSEMDRLKWEKELLGLYVSGHPLRGLSPYIARKGHLIARLSKKNIGKNIKIMGLVSGYRKIMTKTGAQMAMFNIEDSSAMVACVVFPRTFSKYGDSVADDMVIGVTGKLDNKRGNYQVICDSTKPLSLKAIVENAKEANCYDENDTSSIVIRLIDDILSDSETAKNENIYMIEVPDGTSPDLMASLKSLLEENKGESNVAIHLVATDQSITLPFGIELSDSLKEKIKSLLS